MAGGERLICASVDLVDGGEGIRFDLAGNGETRSAFVVRWRNRAFAYINECMHQATELDWNDGDFFDESGLYLMCATHGAMYEPDSGLCIAGPCRGARLVTVEVHERDGNIFCAVAG
jgi:nitrite reductase/ring-hydroxylating ferredoxin subunit